MKILAPKTMVALALGLTVLLTGCGDPDPATSTDDQGAAESAAPESVTAARDTESDPVLTLEEQALSFKTVNIEAYSMVPVPALFGVDTQVQEKFDVAIEEMLMRELEFVAERSEEYWPFPENYCHEAPSDLCGSEVAFAAKKYGIHEQYATISYTVAYNLAGGTSNEDVISLTMDVHTGEVAQPEDFAQNLEELVTNYADQGRCFETYQPGLAAGKITAFSPTDEGLYLSWPMGTFSYAVCASSALTIPWDALESRAGTAADPSKPSSEPFAATALVCDTAELPEGIDPRVCQPTISDRIELLADEYGTAWVMTASGNIWCIFSEEDLGCTINDPLGHYSLGQSGAAAVANFDDGPPGSTPFSISYGEPVGMNGYTCIAQEIGLSCWNNNSGHGLHLSRAQSVLW